MRDLNNLKILAIIPARGGSKGLPRKNVKDLKGKPLIAWTIEAAKNSKYIDKTIVTTEDDEIMQVAKTFGADFIKRPQKLAQDESSVYDAINHALDELKSTDYIPDYVLLMQCTSPLRNAKHVDSAIESFFKDENKFDSFVSVTEEQHMPWWLKTIDENGNLTDLMDYDKSKYFRRQDFPKAYRVNGAIYFTSTQNIYDSSGFEAKKTMPYVMDFNSSVDIDTEEDFLFAEFIMDRL